MKLKPSHLAFLWCFFFSGLTFAYFGFEQKISEMAVSGLATTCSAYAILGVIAAVIELGHWWRSSTARIASTAIGLMFLIGLTFIPGIGAIVMYFWCKAHPEDTPQG